MKPTKASSRNVERAPAPIYSTSEARANFAEALETAQVDCAVIGFERYGRTVAALAPIQAIYMLAGRAQDVPADVRRRIERNARNLVQDIQRFRAQPGDERVDGKALRPRARSSANGSPKTRSKRRPKS
jgi:hypothetical protein